MEKYKNEGLVGEGSYGMVLKCRHKDTGQVVAIKKFLESEDDKMVKKIAIREVKMLQKLRHENLVNLIEFFRRKKRLYLVFEFVDHTVLDDLESCPNGLDENTCREILWQVLKGIEFCHTHNIIHRDIKPENILVSKSRIVKLCDFGFARTIAGPGETYTDYVATRWYRAPELLVGDTRYGRAVDIWAVGCLLAEMLTGEPLFPGDSDIDQLYHIVKCFGNLPGRHKEIFHKNPLFVGMRLPEVREVEPLEKKFPRISKLSISCLKKSLALEANDRPTCSELLKHEFFQKNSFAQTFPNELKQRMEKEYRLNPLIKGDKKGHDRTERNSSSDENKGSGGKKKKKEVIKEKKPESKDSGIEDKQKRKMPEPEKIVKKSSPTTNVTGSLPHTSSSPSKPQNHPSGSVELPSEAVSIPPITNTGRDSGGSQANVSSPHHVSNQVPYPVSSITLVGATSPTHGTGPAPLRGTEPKTSNTKKQQNIVPNHNISNKKHVPPPNHHSQTFSPQLLQSEKSSLHEKTLQYDKMISSKKKDGKFGEKKEKDGQLSLPELKGAEGNPNKNKKKSYLTTMPNITNIDPFNQSGGSDKDSNLPSV